MPFLSVQQIDPVTRDQYVIPYRDKLRQQLLDPSLTDEQRNKVKEMLVKVKADQFRVNQFMT